MTGLGKTSSRNNNTMRGNNKCIKATAFQDERAGRSEELASVTMFEGCKQIGGHWTWISSCDNNTMRNNNKRVKATLNLSLKS